jgi:[protein-PII] uridylyltransferase
MSGPALPVSARALESARAELSEATRRGLGGRGALGRYAARVDALLRQLFEAAAPQPALPVAAIALGGYGRRQLCLFSDIDLLILFEGSIGPADERFLRGFLNPLWDLGVAVGHQVRELADFSELEADNPEFLLALLDARPVAGDRALFDRFTATFHQPATHAQIVASLGGLIDARHARFNDTLYQLEPDVKEAPGGLRDLTAARTIAALTDPALITHGPVEAARLEEAEDYLLRIRSILHLSSGRNQNVLTHELQETTAEQLGYSGALPQQRVERLMSDYFRHARTASRSLQWVRRSSPTPVGPNLGRFSRGVRFIDPIKAARQPETWLSVFEAAVEHQCEVLDDALSVVRQNVSRFAAEDFFPSAEARDELLRFLRPRAGLYARLSEMHDCGLLGQMFPEFQAISWRVIRDFYHKYTVDEHTLLTIRNLERLASACPPGRERFGSLVQELERPELLVLSLLFHDVGKWKDDDHATESVRMADHMMTRLHMPPETREMVDFLIKNHLQMSRVAFHRDTEDPEIVKRFAELVGIEERLKLLCLMTVVDIEAVSQETLTPWKEELLWRLYVDTYNHLTHAYADELIGRQQAGLSDLLHGRPSDIPEAELTHFLEGLPRRYLQLAGADAIYAHVRLSRNISKDDVHIRLERKDSVWELTVVTLDKPFLFSNICGVLSSFGMDILRGHAMTTANGLVLDIVQFVDEERYLELNPEEARERFSEVLNDVLSGRVEVSERLRRREQSVLRRETSGVSPVVHFDNLSSRRYTILEINAGDALGLLYRISRLISRHGCDVDLVLISTEGKKAIDVFHITKAGVKLAEPEQQALRADLQRMLGGSDEVDQEYRPAEQS